MRGTPQLENPPPPCSTAQGSYMALVPLALKIHPRVVARVAKPNESAAIPA